MWEVLTTDRFDNWLGKLRDRKGQAIITRRIVRLGKGNFGDVKWFGGIGELRIAYGPAYRLYFMQQGESVIILLCGGDKGSQNRDIERASKMKEEILNGN